VRQAGAASIAGQSAKPAAEPKLRGLLRTGFAVTDLAHAWRTVTFGKAPWADSGFPCG
jgi:hypothetical protein